jgi:Phage tail assembly chaperone, TAC
MLDQSLFVSTEVVEREVELPDGKKHKLFFKELTAADISRYVNALNSTDEEVNVMANPKLLALSLCEQDGKPAITVEQALKLKPGVIGPILEALREVNGLGGEKKD